MALRARLGPPPPPTPTAWPYHKAKVGSIPAGVLWSGDRRLEAETYLSSGYGIRTAIESKPAGWRRLSELATSWQPSRLKGIQVSRNVGTPFLAATQVFDVRPVPRKWLALAKTSDAPNRFLSPGTVVVTCSGSVGRPTLASDVHRDVLISHDLLRIRPLDERNHGWIYAYLLAEQTRAMTKSAHYGHIIKHLETSHLDALPVPDVDDATARNFSKRVGKVMELRNKGYALTLEAEALFSKALGDIKINDWGEAGFSVKGAEALFSGRRRFDATIHNPGVAKLRRFLTENGHGFTTISDAGYDVWLPTRFRRVPAEDGVLLVDSADLTEVNPDLKKKIADGDFGDPSRGRVEPGWVLMARSGQTYGIIGTTVLAGENLTEKVISDHVMRIRPGSKTLIKPGYLVTAMSHPVFGRPLIKALAYGSSIPEIEVADIESYPVVRLQEANESTIDELATSAAQTSAAADILEREITSDAEQVIAKFVRKSTGEKA